MSENEKMYEVLDSNDEIIGVFYKMQEGKDFVNFVNEDLFCELTLQEKNIIYPSDLQFENKIYAYDDFLADYCNPEDTFTMGNLIAVFVNKKDAKKFEQYLFDNTMSGCMLTMDKVNVW